MSSKNEPNLCQALFSRSNSGFNKQQVDVLKMVYILDEAKNFW